MRRRKPSADGAQTPAAASETTPSEATAPQSDGVEGSQEQAEEVIDEELIHRRMKAALIHDPDNVGAVCTLVRLSLMLQCCCDRSRCPSG